MNDQPESVRPWRWLWRSLIGLALLEALLGVVVTEENWRGKRDWNAYRGAAEAHGERLDLAAVVPPPVPDDQNFFAAPIIAQALKSESDTNAANPLNFDIYRGDPAIWPKNDGIDDGGWQKGVFVHLDQWQTYIRAFNESSAAKTNAFPEPAEPQSPQADILRAFSIFDPQLNELRQASQRPYARLPLNYDNDFETTQELLPWLSDMKRCGKFLEIRSLAEERSNQPEQALADIQLFLRVTDSVRGQPFLISHLVRLAMISIVMQPIYEGLAQHLWSDSQLAELEHALAAEDLLADYKFAIKGEEVLAIDTFEKQRLTREMKFSDDHSRTNQTVSQSLRWMPAAYFYQNELWFARMHDQIASLVDSANQLVSPTAFNRMESDLLVQRKHASPYNSQALMVAPAIASSIKRTVYVQGQLDLAGTACALERYRLAHGSYPDALDALVPQFIEKIPHDLINGQPLHYHTTRQGGFVLYSVGWNEIDDNGTVILGKAGQVDYEKGDWVWQCPDR